LAGQLRSARLTALADAEAFDSIIHVIERIGSHLSRETIGKKGQPGSLGAYAAWLKPFVKKKLGPVARAVEFRGLITPFNELYDLVRFARNEALHQGAFARHLTKHAIELAIVMEDALKTCLKPVVAHFMVRNPLCAELWQPIGFIRQQMLANSYSYLPVELEETWAIVSDKAIAQFLGGKREDERWKKKFFTTLKESGIELPEAKVLHENETLEEASKSLSLSPVLLVTRKGSPDVLGMLTAFDLL